VVELERKHRSFPEVAAGITVVMLAIVQYCSEHKLDLAGAIEEKLEFNRNRADHKLENRRQDGGKKW